MREILFRGYDKKYKRWRYGGLVTIPMPIVPNDKPPFIINEKGVYAVDPDTVGQYTELKDTNGIMIFEGDIIKANDFYYDKTGCNVADTIVIGEVVWDMDRYIVVMGETEWLLGELYLNDDDFEVIGNIHDDPELLEVEE